MPSRDSKSSTPTPTLREIDYQMQLAIEQAEQAADDGELDRAQELILSLVEQEIAKVDRIREYLRFCESMQAGARAEATRQRERAKAWEERGKRLRMACALVMRRRSVERLDGVAGSLVLRRDGGRGAVEINNAELLPEAYRTYSVFVEGERAPLAIQAMRTAFPDCDVTWSSSPRLAKIAEDLASGIAVPGCHLAERGEHLEIR